MADSTIIFRNRTGVDVPLKAIDNLDGTFSLSAGAGELHLGEVGGLITSVDVTPTLSVAATYVANDYVGTDHTAMTFANIVRKNGGSGIIQRAILVDYAKQSIAGELWLFDTAPAGLPDDSAAFTITDADAKQCIGIIPFSTYYTSALNAVAPTSNVGIAFKCTANVDDIYGVFVTRGAPAYATGDLTFRLVCLAD